MDFGYISNTHDNMYLAEALSQNGKYIGIGCVPGSDTAAHVADMLEANPKFVIVDQLGAHTASFSLELEDRGIKQFNGGSIQSFVVKDPDYLKVLGHRIGLPIGGEPSESTRINICVLASRKGVCGPAFLMEHWDRLGPVRCPENVLCSAVVLEENTKIYKEVCERVGKLFASFNCSGVACIEVDIRKDELVITNLSLTPPQGFWALWLEFYAGDDPLKVFEGLATGKKFTYPVTSDKLGLAALLTVPPFPMSVLDVDYQVGSHFIDRVYKDLGITHRVGCKHPINEDGAEWYQGTSEVLGWLVILEEEMDALTILRREAKRLEDQFVQVPYEFPGVDMAYTRALLEKNNWLSILTQV